MSSQDPNQWAMGVLSDLKAPVTPENVSSVLSYAQCGGDVANLNTSSVSLALAHSAPRPVFGSAVGGTTGNCVSQTNTIDLASLKIPLVPGTPGVLPIPGTDGLNPLSGLSSLNTLLKELMSGTLWLRVGEFLLAGILFLAGLYLMASESSAGARLKSQAETAAVVAAAA